MSLPPILTSTTSRSGGERVIQNTTTRTIQSGGGGAIQTQSQEDACVPITDDLWQQILGLYLKVYRGPTADIDLKQELDNYKVLKRDGNVRAGAYVRYMARGVIGSELRRGGTVAKCTTKTVRLQDGRRQWTILRRDNYIFVLNGSGVNGLVNQPRKSLLRTLAEQALLRNAKFVPAQDEDELVEEEIVAPQPERIKLKANFLMN